MSCDECLHLRECFERRGPCREYKTLKGVQREIEELNENYQKIARCTKAGDKGPASDRCSRRWQIHTGSGTSGESDAPESREVGKVKSEDKEG